MEQVKKMVNDAGMDTLSAIAKATPAVGGAWYSAWTLNEWVALATLIYVILQIGLLIPKYFAIFKRRWFNKCS